jgi:hypothetical protein
VKLEIGARYAAAFVLLSFFLSGIAAVAADKKDKAAAQAVDSGSFGIFVKGQRVATETFSVQQQNGGSVTKAELKELSTSNPASQKSSLEISSNGELIRYEWSQSSGVSLTVLPKDEFLIEKVTTPSSSKPAEKPFLMPSSSVILDNNFFVHREILVWRYLGSACKPEGGNFKCPQEATPFGVLVPQDQSSMPIKLQVVGKEKVMFHGSERELLRLNLIGENSDWALWVDDQDQFKLMRVAIPADNTEVVRD